MNHELLIYCLMVNMRAIQQDATKLAEAAINDALLRPIEAGFSDGMALAQQIVALRQSLDCVIAMLEPEAIEYIYRAITYPEHGTRTH